jgi:phosphohistidine swiveling domain-containing protein
MPIIPNDVKLWVQEGPGTMLFFSYPGYAATAETKRQHDFWYEFAVLFVKEGMWLWACDENNMQRIAEKYKEEQKKDKNYTKKLMKEWQRKASEFYVFCKKVDPKKLSALSDQKLTELLEQFTQLYISEYAVPILVDSTGYFFGLEIQNLLKKELVSKGLAKEFNNYLTKLSEPADPSFINEEKIELLKIVVSYINGEDIDHKLETHAKKWFWVHNNYARAIVLDKEYFLARVKEHAKESRDNRRDNNSCLGNRACETIASEFSRRISEFSAQFKNARNKKLKIMKELGLSNDIKFLVQLSDEHVYWQDMRKKANLIADHYIETFLNEISKRKKISTEDLKTTSAYELVELLKGKEISREIFEQRKKMSCMIFTPDSPTLLSFTDTKQIDQEIRKRCSPADINDLFGTVANMGKVTAKAKIILGQQDFDKLMQGDILVTSMTRPEFVPIMKKAAGVITDEGGLTCHAAIVSREFNIPCIVGTKIATKVLKDNDLVEVNANHGVVRKIK